jgi:TPR repeat protein
MTNVNDKFESALSRLEDTGEFSEELIISAQAAAHGGNTKAMCFMGLYALRDDTPDAMIQALGLFEKATAAGDADGSFFLGMMQWKGKHIKNDLKKAVSNLRIAANDGNSDAQLQLGLLFISESGFENSRFEASRLFKGAADQGDPVAQYIFAINCIRGDGVPKNVKMGIRYLRYSADAGCKQAMDILSEVSRS